MINIEYNNNLYQFRSSLTHNEFLNLPYISLPISEWKNASELLFGEFTIEQCKAILRQKLTHASNVSEYFVYNDNWYWIDKSTRAAILNTLSYYDKEDFELVLRDCSIKAKVEVIKKFLMDLDLYSYQCFIKNFEYELAINSLTEIKDLEFIFPEKLKLDVVES